MKKDYSMIDKVIIQQRNQTRAVLGKFYRFIKSVRKALIKNESGVPKLKPFLEKQIADSFRILTVRELQCFTY